MLLVEVAASLHGRTVEQESLLGLLGDARAGRSGAVVVVGEPGAGKSALLELVRTAAEEMVVLEAKGVESEARLPFAALHQLLRPAFGLLERLPSPQADALRAAFALEGGGAPDLYRVPLAVLTLLAEAAEEQPLLCVIDDAQWVDGDSAQALTFAARRLQAERIAIVFAAREGGFDAAALPELSLEPLDTTAVEAILAARAGAAVAPDIARRIAAATLEPDEEVARELEQAAGRARSRNAFTAASAAAERAADLSPSPHEKGRRLAEAASDAWLTGLLPQAARLIEAAEPLVDDPVLLANCHRLRGSIELAAGTSTTATNMLVTGARRLANVDPRRALELLALAAEGASLAQDAEASSEIGELAASLDVGGDEHDQFFIGLLVGFANHLAGDVDTGIAAIR